MLARKKMKIIKKINFKLILLLMISLLGCLLIKRIMLKNELKEYKTEDFYQGQNTYTLTSQKRLHETSFIENKIPYVKVNPQKFYYKYLNYYENIKLFFNKEKISNLLLKKIGELMIFGKTMDITSWEKVIKRYECLMIKNIEQPENINVDYYGQKELLINQIYKNEFSKDDTQKLIDLVEKLPWPDQINNNPFLINYSLKDIINNKAWGNYMIKFDDDENNISILIDNDLQYQNIYKIKTLNLKFYPTNKYLVLKFNPSQISFRKTFPEIIFDNKNLNQKSYIYKTKLDLKQNSEYVLQVPLIYQETSLIKIFLDGKELPLLEQKNLIPNKNTFSFLTNNSKINQAELIIKSSIFLKPDDKFFSSFEISKINTENIELVYQAPLASLKPYIEYNKVENGKYKINLINTNSFLENNFISNLPKNWKVLSKKLIDDYHTEITVIYSPLIFINKIIISIILAIIITISYPLIFKFLFHKLFRKKILSETLFKMKNILIWILEKVKLPSLFFIICLILLDLFLLKTIFNILFYLIFIFLLINIIGYKISAKNVFFLIIILLFIISTLLLFNFDLIAEKIAIYAYLLLFISLIASFNKNRNQYSLSEKIKKQTKIIIKKILFFIKIFKIKIKKIYLNNVFLQNKSFQNSCIIAFFIIIPIFIFRELLFTKGMIIGSDWGLPVSKLQIAKNFNNVFFTWTDQGMLFGSRQSTFNTLPYILFIKSLSILGIQGEIFTKLLLLFSFSFAGFSIYFLLSFFKIKKIPALIGGIIYISTPIFFNYAIMGWMFVLLVMSIFPWVTYLFIRVINENNNKLLVVLGILCALSVIQSQSIVWILLLFLAFSIYLIKSKKTFFLYFKTIIISLLTFFLINFYWIIGLLIISDQNISGSNIMDSAVTLGMVSNFKPIYFVRLFGSLSNLPYELAMGTSPSLGETILSALSFTLPLIVISSLFLKKNKRLIRSFWLISLFPLSIYFLNNFRNVLLQIPYINIIRDFNRFITVSSFAYAVLATFVINHLYLYKKKLLFILLIVLSFSLYPWWRGEITKWENKTDGDMRLRIKQFPKDYYELEEKFAQQKLNQNALYLPANLILNFNDDPKFHGSYNEIVDIFAGYSPISGGIYLSDRNSGYLGSYLQLLNQQINTNFNENSLSAIRLTNIRYIVIKKNVLIEKIDQILKILKLEEEQGQIKKYFETENLLVYEIVNYYPRVYSSAKFIITDKNIEQTLKQTEDIIIFSPQNSNLDFRLFDKISSVPPVIEYKRINPTKYQVVVHKAKNSFLLVLNQSFHDQWRLYLSKNKNIDSKISDQQIKNYLMFKRNEQDQADPQQLNEYIQNNLVSTLGNSQNKISFISKNNYGVIQNNNLLSNNLLTNIKAQQLAKNQHIITNGWSNAWLIDTNDVCNNNSCHLNEDGSYDFELIIEFFPQRVLIAGSIISIAVFIFAVKYLIKKR